jgi:GNAT superfamily N-acetyltransferase
MTNRGNSSFAIRAATSEDIGTLVQLIRHLAEYERLADQAKTTEALLQKYGFGEHAYYHALIVEVADGGEKNAVGFALYFFTFSTFVCRPTLFLEDLFVLPEFRRGGIGKALFIELVRIAGENECGRMEWSVLDWNEPAINFYKALGAKAMSDWTVFRLDEEGISRLRRDNEPSPSRKPKVPVGC